MQVVDRKGEKGDMLVMNTKKSIRNLFMSG